MKRVGLSCSFFFSPEKMGYESLGLVAELSRVKLEQQSTVRNFGSDKIVCTYLRPPLHVSGCGNLSLM